MRYCVFSRGNDFGHWVLSQDGKIVNSKSFNFQNIPPRRWYENTILQLIPEFDQHKATVQLDYPEICHMFGLQNENLLQCLRCGNVHSMCGILRTCEDGFAGAFIYKDLQDRYITFIKAFSIKNN